MADGLVSNLQSWDRPRPKQSRRTNCVPMPAGPFKMFSPPALRSRTSSIDIRGTAASWGRPEKSAVDNHRDVGRSAARFPKKRGIRVWRIPDDFFSSPCPNRPDTGPTACPIGGACNLLIFTWSNAARCGPRLVSPRTTATTESTGAGCHPLGQPVSLAQMRLRPPAGANLQCIQAPALLPGRHHTFPPPPAAPAPPPCRGCPPPPRNSLCKILLPLPGTSGQIRKIVEWACLITEMRQAGPFQLSRCRDGTPRSAKGASCLAPLPATRGLAPITFMFHTSAFLHSSAALTGESFSLPRNPGSGPQATP